MATDGRLKDGVRVKVWNGSGTEYLGLGTFIGTRKVWAVVQVTKNGPQILTLPGFDKGPPTAEQLLDYGLTLGQNCQVRELPDNPVFVLDKDGSEMYGMQVWWIPEIPPEQEEALRPYRNATKWIEDAEEERMSQLPEPQRMEMALGMSIGMFQAREKQRVAFERFLQALPNLGGQSKESLQAAADELRKLQLV